MKKGRFIDLLKSHEMTMGNGWIEERREEWNEGREEEGVILSNNLYEMVWERKENTE